MATAKDMASDTVSFEYGGNTFSVGDAEGWDVEVLEAFEDGKVVTAVRALLGPEQWATFKAGKPTVAELNGLFEVAAEALGLGN